MTTRAREGGPQLLLIQKEVERLFIIFIISLRKQGSSIRYANRKCGTHARVFMTAFIPCLLRHLLMHLSLQVCAVCYISHVWDVFEGVSRALLLVTCALRARESLPSRWHLLARLLLSRARSAAAQHPHHLSHAARWLLLDPAGHR